MKGTREDKKMRTPRKGGRLQLLHFQLMLLSSPGVLVGGALRSESVAYSQLTITSEAPVHYHELLCISDKSSHTEGSQSVSRSIFISLEHLENKRCVLIKGPVLTVGQPASPSFASSLCFIFRGYKDAGK